jgi:hypothetical protein
MKKYMKKKSPKAGPNAAGPKYRTPVHFKGKKFSGKRQTPHAKFNPTTFRVQHRG